MREAEKLIAQMLTDVEKVRLEEKRRDATRRDSKSIIPPFYITRMEQCDSSTEK
jgi:hypothetical protein